MTQRDYYNYYARLNNRSLYADDLHLSNEDNNTEDSLFNEPREESLDDEDETKPLVPRLQQMNSPVSSSGSEVNEYGKPKDAKMTGSSASSNSENNMMYLKSTEESMMTQSVKQTGNIFVSFDDDSEE